MSQGIGIIIKTFRSIEFQPHFLNKYLVLICKEQVLRFIRDLKSISCYCTFNAIRSFYYKEQKSKKIVLIYSNII